MAQKIKTRILIISDTHSRSLHNATDETHAFRQPLPAADVLIHCGIARDMTMQGSLQDYEATLDTIRHVDAPLKLVIAGNHDLTLDKDWMRSHRGDDRINHVAPDEHDGSVYRDFWTNSQGRAVRDGVTFLDEGVHRFRLANGASLKVYASPYTPAFWDWGFAYELDEDRFNSPAQSLVGARNIAERPIPSFSSSSSSSNEAVDVLITHGPPYKRLDLTDSGAFAGCPHLLRGLMRCRPLVHCFGHIHEGWGAEVVNWARDVAKTAVMRAEQSEWTEGLWERGIDEDRGVRVLATDSETGSKKRSVHVDMSSSGENELVRGEQTLMVNAAIVDIHYAAVNAPVLVDVDLFASSGE